MRLQEARADPFRRLAKREGYRSRAAYKLLEVQRRFSLLARGHRVLDLGAAPGSWLQVASSLVGEEGLVVGVDLLPIREVAKNVVTLVADIRDSSLIEALRRYAPFDVVLFDASPSMSGVIDIDVRAHASLLLAAARISGEVLRPGGAGAYKLLEHEELRELEREIAAMFSSAKRFKPSSSRKRSRELYLVCRGFIRS
jgi:23S rRNA (uridine2552-2'-O)-methyltransferase